ncbi:MAG: DUF86 domain-containing protein [Prevotella sp.]|nr:DUF86 domain-containing protein [Prevotella sp.]
MREQPKDRNRLQHILEAIDTIQERCSEMKREDLTADKVLFGGIVYHTIIIGEAAYNLSKAFIKAHPETPWLQIAKMRHNLAHGYYQVDADIVWSVIQYDLQPLREQVVRYLNEVDWDEWEKNEQVIKETVAHKALMQTASRMKSKGYDVREIMSITGLTAEEIEGL